MELYTMEMWVRDGSFKANVGQEIADDIVMEMVNSLPPRNYRSDCTQIGGAYSHREDLNDEKWKATYTTFKANSDGNWIFCGHCFANETQERGKDICYS